MIVHDQFNIIIPWNVDSIIFIISKLVKFLLSKLQCNLVLFLCKSKHKIFNSVKNRDLCKGILIR